MAFGRSEICHDSVPLTIKIFCLYKEIIVVSPDGKVCSMCVHVCVWMGVRVGVGVRLCMCLYACVCVHMCVYVSVSL